jgi:hypothetical protein
MAPQTTPSLAFFRMFGDDGRPAPSFFIRAGRFCVNTTDSNAYLDSICYHPSMVHLRSSLGWVERMKSGSLATVSYKEATKGSANYAVGLFPRHKGPREHPQDRLASLAQMRIDLVESVSAVFTWSGSNLNDPRQLVGSRLKIFLAGNATAAFDMNQFNNTLGQPDTTDTTMDAIVQMRRDTQHFCIARLVVADEVMQPADAFASLLTILHPTTTTRTTATTTSRALLVSDTVSIAMTLSNATVTGSVAHHRRENSR